MTYSVCLEQKEYGVVDDIIDVIKERMMEVVYERER